MSDNVIEMCVEFLIGNAAGHIFQAFDLAVAFDVANLKQFSSEALNQILDFELLCSECDVFEVCVKGAAAHAGSGTLRNKLGPCFHKIRFTSLSHEQLSVVMLKHPDLFAASEALNVFMAISKVTASGAKEVPDVNFNDYIDKAQLRNDNCAENIDDKKKCPLATRALVSLNK